MNSRIARTSASVTHAPWIRTGFEMLDGANSMSPCPTSFSAPFMSSITRESACEDVISAIRDGMFALISPVTTSTDGRCVATTRHPDRAGHLRDPAIASSTSRGATIIRSASSSITTTMNGMCSNFSSIPGGIRSVSSRRPSS